MPAAAAPLAEPPTSAASLCRAALAQRGAGRPALALDLLERAIEMAPESAVTWAEAGATLIALGRSTEGLSRLRRAVLLDPYLSGARAALGLELLCRGVPRLAAEQFALAAHSAPNDWTLQVNLGLSLQRAGAAEAAVAPFRTAARLAPDQAVCHNALGTALHQTGRLEAAVEAYTQALRLRPDWPEGLANLGCTLRALGEPGRAVACYDRALARAPDFAPAHWNRALARLSLGRLAEAWEDHEWRWQVADFPSPRRGFRQPLWGGEDIVGRHILLHAEQGFGDTLQALRYVPMVAARGAEITLEVPRELLRLAVRMPGPSRVVPLGEALPTFDLHAPLLSLPRAFATTLDSIPATVPYLTAPPADVARWRERLAPLPGLRVGLVWAGRPTHGNDANRSLPFAALAPLLALDGVSFVSLQLGRRAAEAHGRPEVADVSDGLADFADTAAALLALDALVAVDTAVVHLAGALGVAAHVLLPYAPDWRWLLGRSDSPWYPTLRLHRQAARGDWSAPLDSVGAALRHMLAQSSQPKAA